MSMKKVVNIDILNPIWFEGLMYRKEWNMKLFCIPQ